jgi:hypothetical protein
MPRKKMPRVEIVPRTEEALVPPQPDERPQAMLDRIVRERVDEIMAERGAGHLDPDFQTREVGYGIQRRQTVFERRRWSINFEKHGCRRCDDQTVSHIANGYYKKCYGLLFQRLRKR